MEARLLKTLWVRFAFLILIGLGVLGWLHLNRLEKESLELEKDQESIRISYAASNMMFRLATKEAFDLAINTPQMLKLLREGVNSSGKAQAKARGELYRQLYPTYLSLSTKNLRQLHYQLPNGESYLRFHKPDRYGDSVFDARPSIRIANEKRERVEGFEIGKVVSGYRYVYPLEFEGEFLGTVETSVPVKSILDALKYLDGSREYAYIIDSQIAKELLFEEQTHLYTPSDINSNFYIEDALQELPDSPPPLSKTAKAINEKLAKDGAFQKALEEARPYGTFVFIDGESYSVTLQPMSGVERGVEGFLVAYQKDQTPQILSRDFWIVFALALTWGIVIFFLMYKAERKNIQILSHKEQLQTLINTLSEGVYVMNRKGIITEVNATACMLLGYKHEEMIGTEAHALFHAHSRDKKLVTLEECPIFEALQEGTSYRSTEEYFRHKNGSLVEVRVGANPLIEDGYIKSMVTVFSDITQEKADEAQKRLLTQALESSSNAIVITDKDAIIQWANPAFENLTGFKPQEAIGRKPKDLVASGKQSEEFYAAMWEAILHGVSWSGEVINKRKDGVLYTEELNITPVLGSDGEVAHFIAIKQDISKRKAYEENLKIAKENAEEAMRAKTDFLANMSHEIRTPLNAIIGLNELLSQTSLTARQEELLKKTNDSSKLLLHIVNDILDYSKIKAGELELHSEAVKLEDVLGQIESIFNESAIKKGIDLSIQSPKPLPYLIQADGLRLLQVLTNLVGNGVKFTHEGSVELRVTILNQSVKKVTLLFEVIDTGIGMSKAQVARVFEPFTQADTSITRRYGGSGLGLSIAKDLVKAIGGELRIKSQEGEGTTTSFAIKVPVVAWEGETKPVDKEVLPDLRGCSILIIEDSPINQEVARRMCERVGASVDVAGDGEEGVGVFMNNP
jgi:PAS domain S-box-containing protein